MGQSNSAYPPDTGQPRGPVPLDPEAGRTLGTHAGTSAAVGETGARAGYGVLEGYLIPERGKVAYGEAFMQAAPGYYFAHEPAVKQAQEAAPPWPEGLTSQPVAGSETELYKLNGLAYSPHPKAQPSIRPLPTTQTIVQTQTSMGADLLPSSEDAMLALLTDF